MPILFTPFCGCVLIYKSIVIAILWLRGWLCIPLLFIKRCREHCLAVKDLYCFKEWLAMEENARKGIYKPALMLLTLPECNRLPSMHQEPTVCTRIPHFGKHLSKLYNSAIKLTLWHTLLPAIWLTLTLLVFWKAIKSWLFTWTPE